MDTDPLKGVFVAGWPWGVVTLGLGACLGALGGATQLYVSKLPRAKGDVLKSAIIGLVATLAALWTKPPAASWSLIEFVGFCVAAGFFGQTVLATVQARVTAALLEQRATKTADVAEAAIREAAGRSRPDPSKLQGAPPADDPVIASLRTRLAEARGPS